MDNSLMLQIINKLYMLYDIYVNIYVCSLVGRLLKIKKVFFSPFFKFPFSKGSYYLLLLNY